MCFATPLLGGRVASQTQHEDHCDLWHFFVGVFMFVIGLNPRSRPESNRLGLVNRQSTSSKVCAAVEFDKNGYKDFYVLYRHTRNHVAE